uniref:Uncharacterized protein n=1 Tax=Rhizophora mucronata TaxID=61149 RepID=A0A2P2NMI7_RHIMU
MTTAMVLFWSFFQSSNTICVLRRKKNYKIFCFDSVM